MKILITGATGMVGREVGKKLVRAGHTIFVISRNAEKAHLELPFPCDVIEGDLSEEPIKNELLREVEAVVHLAGESVAEARWSDQKKKRIYSSRASYTSNMITSLVEMKARVRVFVSTSATGYYGDRGDEVLTEDSNQGAGFLSDVCRDWERPVTLAQGKNLIPGCRYVILRVGVVLNALAGALTKMLPLFQNGFGGAVGDGQQWMSWIHVEDLTNLYVEAIGDRAFAGIINAVAPGVARNVDFSKDLAHSLGKNLGPAVPAFVLKSIFGEMSHVILSSQRLEPKALKQIGFEFKYPDLNSAFSQVAELVNGGDAIFYCEQYLSFKREKVFQFFADAKNLETITPPLLQFHVLGMSTPEIQGGSLIDYKLKIHGVPVRWRTEILDWQPPQKFVDTQLKGPYTKWHHTHEFSDLGPGTLMTDMVRYRVPLGSLGLLAAGRLVSRDVKKIFEYRREVCSQYDYDKNFGSEQN